MKTLNWLASMVHGNIGLSTPCPCLRVRREINRHKNLWPFLWPWAPYESCGHGRRKDVSDRRH